MEPSTDAGRLYDYICLDPEQQWTLGMGFVEAREVVLENSGGHGAITIERLVAYPTRAQARRAVRGLVAQVDRCGAGLDHAGDSSSWRVSEPNGLSTADEALRLTYRTEDVPGTVVTVVRVGRAVFYVDRRQQLADGVADDRRTIVRFIPTLATAFG